MHVVLHVPEERIMSTYFCAHCGKRSGMMGHYRTELHTDRPLPFCPETIDVHKGGDHEGMRCGFTCDEDHICHDTSPKP